MLGGIGLAIGLLGVYLMRNDFKTDGSSAEWEDKGAESKAGWACVAVSVLCVFVEAVLQLP